MSEEKRRIEFSQNWNGKLFTSHYTTLRLASSKYQVGRFYDVYLKKEFLHTVKLIEVSFIMIDELTEVISRLDTGYNKVDTQELLKQFYPEVDWSSQRISVLLLSRMYKRLIDSNPKDGNVEMCLYEKRVQNLKITSFVDYQDFK